MFYRVLPISQKRRNSTWDEARTVVVQPRHRCECERSPERRPSLGFELGEFLGKMVLQLGDGSKPWYLVNPKIAGKWMFIPLKMVLIGIDPYPNLNGSRSANCRDHIAMFPRVPGNKHLANLHAAVAANGQAWAGPTSKGLGIKPARN